jgi:bifunctional UDP-N-acetylglucosamine pyrophosphorylase/glucosamine-1-phosphate N-acetyltransferase
VREIAPGKHSEYPKLIMKLEVVILAAGQGTRMKSRLPKVLHEVAGKPLLEHVVRTAQGLGPAAIHVVIGHGAEQVERALDGYGLNWVIQEQQLGTGHAVMQALPAIGEDSVVLVLYGDVPLTSLDTLQGLVESASGAPALLTASLEDPGGYGRILRGEGGELLGVVEHKDASEEQRAIREINTGVLAAPAADLREYLPRVGNENQQGEYYLPDILAMAVAEGRTVASSQAESEIEILGVNDRVQLNQVEREYQRRQAERLMRLGVSLADATRLDIRGELVCGEDVSIDVNAVFEGEVRLGDGVSIGPNCVLRNVTVDSGSIIHAMSHLEDSTVGSDCNVGPYARVRPGTVLADGAKLGNFVETKKANIGPGSKVNHLSYVGDCDMGAGVNVGAGTITCNYDGVNKYKTELGDGVFIGSNSTLIAPLRIAEGGYIGAGSTITRTVEQEELGIGRAQQRNIQGWQRPGKQHDKD